MSSYNLQGKFAIVTGAGSGKSLYRNVFECNSRELTHEGINHSLTIMLLEAGCSVMMADLKLRPEAEATLAKYKEGKSARAIFQQVDLSDWSQITALWNAALEAFPHINLLVNGAGLYEQPNSNFWNLPGISPLAKDAADAKIGQYNTFAVNSIAPIRLAQLAIDYWLENREVEANLLWIASLGSYVHSIQTPMYFASKAVIVSMAKSFAPLRKTVGIKNSCVCPGAVYVRT